MADIERLRQHLGVDRWLVVGAQRWPGGELVVVDEGHGGGPAMTSAIASAIERCYESIAS